MSRTALAVLLLVPILSACATPPSPAPDGAAPGVIRTGESLHVVRRGEDFAAIARLYGVTERALRERNRALSEPLPAGCEVSIPPNKPEVRRIEPAAAPR